MSRIFADTNIWFYAFVQGEGEAEQQKTVIAQNLLREHKLTLSVQVINELSFNLLRKAKYSEPYLRALVNSLHARYQVQAINLSMFIKASELREHYYFSYWDSLIVAAALSSECNILLSEDMQHGLEVEGQLVIKNPFV